MSDPDDSILVSRENGVLSLTLNRPQFRNALSSEMAPMLTRLMRDAQADAGVRCVVISGAGEHFTAGGDVAGFRRTLELTPAERQQEFYSRLDRGAEMVEAFVAFDRPIVARVRGAVAGAGLMLILVADLVLADETATFVFAHQRMALIPDCGVSWMLPRAIGLRQAKRLLLTAALVDAPEAQRLGLATSIHAAADLEAAAAKAVASLARAPQEAVKASKRLLGDSLGASLSDQLRGERDAIVHCVGQDDFPEAVNAFLDKRQARFPSAQ